MQDESKFVAEFAQTYGLRRMWLGCTDEAIEKEWLCGAAKEPLTWASKCTVYILKLIVKNKPKRPKDMWVNNICEEKRRISPQANLLTNSKMALNSSRPSS